MTIESQNNKNDTSVIALVSAYTKAVYSAKGDISNQTVIKIKNQIVVLLGGMYQDIVNNYLKKSGDKKKITSFIESISVLMQTGIFSAQEDIYHFLLDRNSSLSYSEEELEQVGTYIRQNIKQRLDNVQNELNNLVAIVRQRCLEILLAGQKSTSHMLEMSHTRNKRIIDDLRGEISVLKQDITKKQEIIAQGYASWRKLNQRVGTLEKEKEDITDAIKQIKAELLTKKRDLKGSTLEEQIQGILTFIHNIQQQETLWQKTYVQQQNFDQLEANLQKEITRLNEQLKVSKSLNEDMSNELFEEQRRVETLTSVDKNRLLGILRSQIYDYFDFLYNADEFLNMTKQAEGELAIKITYYRAKSLNLDIEDDIQEQLKSCKDTYIQRYTNHRSKIDEIYDYINTFIHNMLGIPPHNRKDIADTYETIYNMT